MSIENHPTSRNEAEYFRSCLRYATELEKYVYTWEASLEIAQNELKSLEESANTIDEQLSNRISVFENDDAYEAYLSDCKQQIEMLTKDGKKAARGRKISKVILTCLFPPSLLFFQATDEEQKIDKNLHELQRLCTTLPNQRKAYLIRREQAEENYNNLKKQCDILEKDVTEISLQYQQARNMLDALYEKQKWPEKYRNLVAVATMYEYLDTGRCIEIRGHGGIFDTYEKDVRSAEIVYRLGSLQSTLQHGLSMIRENQEILHMAVEDAGVNLRNISSGLGKIQENQAMNTMINQQNEAHLRWMNEQKQLEIFSNR